MPKRNEIAGLKSNDGILVFDMVCKKLAINAPHAENNFDIQSLAPGVYILQITNDHVWRSQFKIIKNCYSH